jgi:hypothetical protein
VGDSSKRRHNKKTASDTAMQEEVDEVKAERVVADVALAA